MAAKDIAIGIVANTKQFFANMKKGVIDPTEEAKDTLDDLSAAFSDAAEASEEVGKDGARSLDKLEDALQDAQKETEQTTKATKRLHDAVEDGNPYKKFSRNTDQATTKAKQNMEEVKQEAKANASETFSSFDGSATSFLDGIQGTFGGLVAAFGPLGLALAAGAAAGIGLISSNLEKAKERAEKARQKVSSLTTQMIEAGDEGTEAFESINAELKEMAAQTEKGEKSLKDIARQAHNTGNDFELLADAFAGNPEALRESIELTKKQIETDQAYLDANNSWTDRIEGNYERRIGASKELLTELETLQGATDQAAESERLWLESNGPKYETKAELIETIDSAYDAAAGAVDDFIDAESGFFNVSKYLSAMKKREKALEDYQTNLAKANLSPEAIRFLNDQGTDAAAAMLQGYVDASPKQKRELRRIWSEAGKEASGVFEDKIEGIVNKTYTGPKIKPTIDKNAWENGVRQIQNQGINVPVTFVTRDGRKFQ